MTYSTKTVKELQELRNEFFDAELASASGSDLEAEYCDKLNAVCEELKLRSEQQKEKLKNLCKQLAV